MSPFDVLGILPDAEPVAVKRAYARMLRKHRPDEDPAGFQRVHDAYQACMAHAERLAYRRQAQAVQAQTKAVPEPDPAGGSEALHSSAGGLASSGEPDRDVSQSETPLKPAEPVSSQASEPKQRDPVQSAPVPPFETGPREPAKPLRPEPITNPKAVDPDPSANNVRPIRPAAGPGDRDPGRPAAPKPQLELPKVLPSAPRPFPNRPAESPPAPPRQIRFPLTEFVDALCERDASGKVELLKWLQRFEPLYDIGLKQAITGPTLQLLSKRPEPLSPDALQVLLGFLGLDTISPERRSMESLITLLESRSRAARAIHLNEPPVATGSRPEKAAAARRKPRSGLHRFVDRELTDPPNLWRRATVLLVPGLKGQMRRILADLALGPDLSRDSMFAKGAMPFWQKALDPSRVSGWRLLSTAVNIAAWMIVLLACFGDWTAGAVLSYAIVGTLTLCGWFLLAFNDAIKLRRRKKGHKPGWMERLVAAEFRLPRSRRNWRRAAILMIPGGKGRMRTALAAYHRDFDLAKDPTFDRQSLAFWNAALDPMHVSRWRFLAVAGNTAIMVLALGLLSLNLALMSAYAGLGIVGVFGWLALAANDARRLRSAHWKAAASRTGSVKVRNTHWRWIIWALIAGNVLLHALTNQ